VIGWLLAEPYSYPACLIPDCLTLTHDLQCVTSKCAKLCHSVGLLLTQLGQPGTVKYSVKIPPNPVQENRLLQPQITSCKPPYCMPAHTSPAPSKCS
jgi:hypothetical protein